MSGSPYCSGCGAPLENVAAVAAPVGVSATVPEGETYFQTFLAEGQDPALVKQSYERATSILMAGEAIEYIAIAMRGGLGTFPDCVVATNKRLMLYRKKVLGKYEVDDCHWRDVGDASMKDGKLGVTLTVATIQGWPLVAEALPETQARRILDIAYRHSERLAGASRPVQTSELTAPPLTTPSELGALVAPVPAATSPAAPMAAAATPVPANPFPLVAQPSSPPVSPVPVAPQVAQPEPIALSNQAPTPESVLQSILQAQGIADNGAPTRPMQFSAAAFQAPVVADGQPVTIRNTDTDPHMRPTPPLPTLEQIAVFSGPLTFSQIPSGGISSPLDQYPLVSDLSSSPLGKPPGSGPLSQLSEANSGSLTVSNADTAGGSPNGYSFQGNTSGSLPGSGQVMRGSGPLMSPVETEQQREHLDTLMVISEMMSDVVTTDPNMANDLMALPGSHSSGPLLEASFEEIAGQGGIDSSLNSGSLPTQQLYMESPLDGELDRPTDINLGLYSVSGPLSSGEVNGAPSKAMRVSSGTSPRLTQPRGNPDDPIAKMKKLKMLLDSGFITQEDYEAKKADILERFF